MRSDRRGSAPGAHIFFGRAVHWLLRSTSYMLVCSLIQLRGDRSSDGSGMGDDSRRSPPRIRLHPPPQDREKSFDQRASRTNCDSLLKKPATPELWRSRQMPYRHSSLRRRRRPVSSLHPKLETAPVSHRWAPSPWLAGHRGKESHSSAPPSPPRLPADWVLGKAAAGQPVAWRARSSGTSLAGDSLFARCRPDTRLFPAEQRQAEAGRSPPFRL